MLMSTRRPPRSSNKTGSNRRTPSRRKGLSIEWPSDRSCHPHNGRLPAMLRGAMRAADRRLGAVCKYETDATRLYSPREAEAPGSHLQGSVGPGRGSPQAMVPGARDGASDGVVCERLTPVNYHDCRMRSVQAIQSGIPSSQTIKGHSAIPTTFAPE